MDHSKNRNLQAKRANRAMLAIPMNKEKDICKSEKQFKISQILSYYPGKYSQEELERKNLNRIREIYDTI